MPVVWGRISPFFCALNVGSCVHVCVRNEVCRRKKMLLVRNQIPYRKVYDLSQGKVRRICSSDRIDRIIDRIQVSKAASRAWQRNRTGCHSRTCWLATLLLIPCPQPQDEPRHAVADTWPKFKWCFHLLTTCRILSYRPAVVCLNTAGLERPSRYTVSRLIERRQQLEWQ